MTRVTDYFSLGVTQGGVDFVDVDVHTDVPVYIDPTAIRHQTGPWADACLVAESGGVEPGTYAAPEEFFTSVSRDPAHLKNIFDLPGSSPQVYRILEPPAGTPIQYGTVPGGEYGGIGGAPEVLFPEGF